MYNDFFLKSLKNINFDVSNLNTVIYDEEGCHYDNRKEFANIRK